MNRCVWISVSTVCSFQKSNLKLATTLIHIWMFISHTGRGCELLYRVSRRGSWNPRAHKRMQSHLVSRDVAPLHRGETGAGSCSCYTPRPRGSRGGVKRWRQRLKKMTCPRRVSGTNFIGMPILTAISSKYTLCYSLGKNPKCCG